MKRILKSLFKVAARADSTGCMLALRLLGIDFSVVISYHIRDWDLLQVRLPFILSTPMLVTAQLLCFMFAVGRCGSLYNVNS